MAEVLIGDRAIGDGHPVFVVAEIGVNHNGSMPTAKKLIDAAASAGADAVKFQKRNLKQVYQQEILDNPNLGEQSFQYMIPLLREFEFSEHDYFYLAGYAREKGLIFLCTPFDSDSADFVDSLKVPAYKIASADMINFPLLEHILSKGKPLLISTGMSTMEELDITVEFLKERGAQFALLHCNSTYPAPFEDLNLRFIQMMKKRYGVPIGYSGHERGIAMSTLSTALGACLVERHITLDRTMPGPDHAASLEPQGFEKMIKNIRQAEVAMGSGAKKIFNRGEILNREVLGKSLMAAVDIPKGTVIARNMVVAKSPGKWLSPQRLFDLVGRAAERDIAIDEPFTEEDIGEKQDPTLTTSFQSRWGFKARFHNLDDLLPHNPKLLEFHFTDEDLNEEFKGNHYNTELYIHAPEYWFRQIIDLCSFDEEVREKSVEVIQATINKAREMAPYFKGNPKIVMHVGGMDVEPVEDTERLLYNAETAFRRFDLNGVEMLPENLPPRPWYFAGQWHQNAFIHAEEMVDFCKSLDLNMCLDVSHAKLYCNLYKKDLNQYVKAVAPWVKHLHISDAAGIDGEGLQIGDGEIDFEQIFRLLEGRDFSWVPEIWRGHQRKARGFFIALQRLSQFSVLTQGRAKTP
ncbi:MAG: N-acetylneuraminate synthase family protein [Dehalococcoidia bacterium]